MRITSELLVAQLVRRLFPAGDFAVVVRKGAEAAGAIFIVARHRAGRFQLYGPAPQSLSEESGERQFIVEPAADEAALEEALRARGPLRPGFLGGGDRDPQSQAFDLEIVAAD